MLATSLVARRFGASVAGIVGGLPGIAAPILLVVTVQHGRAFGADAAAGTLLGSVALVGFLVAYGGVSRRAAWPAALAAAFAAFFGLVAALRPLHVAVLTALVLAVTAIAAGLVVLPRARVARGEEAGYPRSDLPLRALAAAVPVVVLTASARALGPHLTGLLSAFPILTPVLAAFTHAQRGAEEAVVFLRGMTSGLFAYALFCFLVALLLERLGIGPTFVVAAAAALGLQAALVAGRGYASRSTSQASESG
ncbi:MAG TPA: hypothetical protein VFI04_05880 [Gaiellaceae bacterium]|nr:hypothetical protein [Gaiellaceae bacterium]